MRMCEWGSYIKVHHAVQLLGGVNILPHEEKYSYGDL